MYIVSQNRLVWVKEFVGLHIEVYPNKRYAIFADVNIGRDDNSVLLGHYHSVGRCRGIISDLVKADCTNDRMKFEMPER